MFLLSDGDAIELGAIPKPPASVRDVYVLGVGDPNQGTFIDDHVSRQDASILGTLAGRLRGNTSTQRQTRHDAGPWRVGQGQRH